jgi:glycosyltransferase involved in cell wall biosynthesis
MISILIPVYNGIEFIHNSIHSVINQTFNNWELLIGINGHPKNSAIYKIAKTYETKCKRGKIRVFDFCNIKGKSATLNELTTFCSYAYIAILDVDDIWRPDKLQIQVPFLKHFDVIGSNCIWFGDKPGIIPQIPVGDISSYDFTLVNPIINSSSIIKRELCHWNKDMSGLNDYDMWLRIRQLKRKFYNCPEVLVLHRIHRNSFYNAKGNHTLVDGLLKKYKSAPNSTRF